MSRPPKGTLCQRDKIVQTLTGELDGGFFPVNLRLPSLRALARRFKTGVKPVEKAMAILAEQGYVERRHGSGVYVLDRPRPLNMADSAVLLIEASDHVFGDLTRLLLSRLHDLGLFASTVDISHADAAGLLHRSCCSAARFVIAHATSYFPFEALRSSALLDKPVIAVLAWESDLLLDHVHRILVDHGAGSRLLADRLWSRGHRRVLISGPENMIEHADVWDGRGTCPCRLNVQGTGLAVLWRQRGGHVVRFPWMASMDGGPQHDIERLLAILQGRDAPTAVVGLRDTDAWDVHETLRRFWPKGLNHLAFAGNGDTPWNRTCHPRFITLNWNLETVADLAVGIIRDVEGGKKLRTPVVRMISPRLVAGP